MAQDLRAGKLGVKTQRRRTGCWTCRRRGYRCDEHKPGCHTCGRLGIFCEGYGLRLNWDHARAGGVYGGQRGDAGAGRVGRAADKPQLAAAQTERSGAASVAAAVSARPGRPLHLFPGGRAVDVFLLQHFFFTVSSLLSSTPNRSINTYTCVVLPMAMQCECLLSTILGLSAIHLASRHPVFEVDGRRLKGRGLRGLLARLGRQDDDDADDDDCVLATILMLSILEVFEANAGLWSCHLQGAGSFLAEHLGRVQPTRRADTRKLLDIYAYHEVLASISQRRAPRMPQHCTAPTATGAWSAFAASPDPDRGSAFLTSVDSLLSLIAQLSVAMSSPGAAADQARTVAALRRWRCPDGAGCSPETRHTAEAMRQAALLLQRPAADDDDERLRAVDSILRAVVAVDVRHPAVASHVWPLYMAGIAASDERHLLFIRQRLGDMASLRGMRSIVQVQATLEQLWSGEAASENAQGVVLF